MRPSFVNRFPSLPIDAFAIRSFKPVPVALGEVRNLCALEQSAVTTEPELIHETCSVGVLRGTPTDPVGFARPVNACLRPAGIHAERVLADSPDRLRRPNFELLRPSVVIRRRPQRY